MGKRQRVMLLGIATVIAIAAVLTAVVGGGGSDDDVIDTRTQTTSVQAPASTTATTTTTPKSKPTVPTVVVRDGEPVGGVRRIRFKKGSTIRFTVKSDTADEIHFHGYDISKDIAVGGTARFSVPAKIDGRFELELEQSATPIAEIEVVP